MYVEAAWLTQASTVSIYLNSVVKEPVRLRGNETEITTTVTTHLSIFWLFCQESGETV